jgi:hypothetical protein
MESALCVRGDISLCSGCGEVFKGVSVFSSHRYHGSCKSPASLGLVLAPLGYWFGG